LLSSLVNTVSDAALFVDNHNKNVHVCFPLLPRVSNFRGTKMVVSFGGMCIGIIVLYMVVDRQICIIEAVA